MIVKEKWQRLAKKKKKEFQIILLHNMKNAWAFSVTGIIAKINVQIYHPQWEKLKMQIYLDFVSFGLLQLATTNRGSRPEIQDDPGGKSSGRRRRTQHHQQRTRLHVDDELQQHQQGTLLHADDELPTRNFRRETTTSKDEVVETSKGGTTIQTDDQGKHSHSK